jgi:hypothetical protein
MSNTAGRSVPAGFPTRVPATAAKGLASEIAEREAGDSLLRFLSRLSAFGLAAGKDPLLKPIKPAG